MTEISLETHGSCNHTLSVFITEGIVLIPKIYPISQSDLGPLLSFTKDIRPKKYSDFTVKCKKKILIFNKYTLMNTIQMSIKFPYHIILFTSLYI